MFCVVCFAKVPQLIFKIIIQNEEKLKMFAVIKASGRQYRVSEGSIIKVNRMPGSVGDEISLTDSVLALDDGKTIKVEGLEKKVVKAAILEQSRDKKIVIFKKKRRKGYQRKMGHRQDMTVLRIDSIK